MTVNKNMPILIVGDYSTMRLIVKNLLKQLGFYNTLEAADGSEALEKLHAKPFELVISDWNMEPMTGLELLKQIRADEKLKAIPFIMIAAENKPENVIVAKQAGVNGYILKPFNADTLKAKMISIVGAFS